MAEQNDNPLPDNIPMCFPFGDWYHESVDPPEDPQEGDVWKSPESHSGYIYNDTEWVLLASPLDNNAEEKKVGRHRRIPGPGKHRRKDK